MSRDVVTEHNLDARRELHLVEHHQEETCSQQQDARDNINLAQPFDVLGVMVRMVMLVFIHSPRRKRFV